MVPPTHAMRVLLESDGLTLLFVTWFALTHCDDTPVSKHIRNRNKNKTELDLQSTSGNELRSRVEISFCSSDQGRSRRRSTARTSRGTDDGGFPCSFFQVVMTVVLCGEADWLQALCMSNYSFSNKNRNQDEIGVCLKCGPLVFSLTRLSGTVGP